MTTGGKVVGKISQGLFVLLGVKKGDTKSQADLLVEKLTKLRTMSDENDKMNLSIKDTNSSVLLVSQFTLNADTSAGNRPSFVKAEDPGKAMELYNYFIEKLRGSGVDVETGEFGAYMHISCELDGPVTIVLED